MRWLLGHRATVGAVLSVGHQLRTIQPCRISERSNSAISASPGRSKNGAISSSCSRVIATVPRWPPMKRLSVRRANSSRGTSRTTSSTVASRACAPIRFSSRSERSQKPDSRMTFWRSVNNSWASPQNRDSRRFRNCSSHRSASRSVIHSSGQRRTAGTEVASCFATVVFPEPGRPQSSIKLGRLFMSRTLRPNVGGPNFVVLDVIRVHVEPSGHDGHVFTTSPRPS